MASLYHLPLLLSLLVLSYEVHGLSWPFSSSPPNAGASSTAAPGIAAEFSIESLKEDPKGIKLLEDAKRKLAGPSTCWQSAYRNLFSSCSEIAADKEKQSSLAWHLSDCFQKDSGRPPFPACDGRGPMVRCLKKLNDFEHKIYLEFFLETNSICHQLQTSAFKHDTERLVNDLAKSALFAEEKLVTIEERSEQILDGTSKIKDSVNWLGLQTEQLAKASRDVGVQINDVLKHSEVIYEQSKGIEASQRDLQEGQAQIKEKMESGMARLQESVGSLGDGMEKLMGETVEIERRIEQVGSSISSKMEELQCTTNDIGNVAGTSLEKQKMLLHGQSRALEGLDTIQKFQSKALEESRMTLKGISDLAHKQQEDQLQRQKEIERAHGSLIQNTQSLLAAQKEFELKQANIFALLDKLFALHNAILAESRFVKAFFFYFFVVLLLYMLTSTKQTFGIRAHLYLGLCITFVIELAIIRFGAEDFDGQTWITSRVFLMRSTFLLLASIHILHSIFTYRDYEILNYQMLQTLIERVGALEHNSANKLLPMSTDSDVSISQYSWLEDEDFLEEVDSNVDPDFVMPEEVGENSIVANSFSGRYHLRPRNRR